MRQVEFVAPHLHVASIQGEPGAGKQTLARLLHCRSIHARSTFQHCDAREWLLSEVDPHYLTGLTYLDRVDLLAAPGQALLLRVLRSLEHRSAGTFALLASSESSLRELAAAGRFTPELAFRLTAIHFDLPPLRERREDIIPLATFFLENIRSRYAGPHLALASGAVASLLQHDWPANVRELLSVLESAALSATHGMIRAEDLAIIPTPVASSRLVPSSPAIFNLDAVIFNHIHMVLELNHGNKLKTARQLGISRSTLYRLLGSHHTTSL